MSDKNPQRQGNLEGTLVIVAAGPGELFLVREKDVNDPMADAQMYELDTESLLDEIKPLGIWLKFMYNVDGVIPPVAFTQEEAQRRVRTYKAAKRARDEAGKE